MTLFSSLLVDCNDAANLLDLLVIMAEMFFTEETEKKSFTTLRNNRTHLNNE